MRMHRLLAACLLGAAAACDGNAPMERRATAPAATLAKASAPSRVVDSILPIEEHLRRFRATLAPVESLAGGAGSRDSLVAAMVRATAAGDTLSLRGLLLTKAEYAWLYYPAHIYAATPYELDPATFWMMIGANGEKGLTRLLRQRAGQKLSLRAYQCEASKALHPPAREWNHCSLQLVLGGEERAEQLFGSIVELDGRFKIVSYANQF